ncbi:hypothetical protein [Dyadobacter bucti]|uniref:hypothetical protein n=1 Tax=Dyadobacter bucti TaxID=2572203 RepID=UPI0011098829|nr:hypothetical protein [Dyadobacter bucti]
MSVTYYLGAGASAKKIPCVVDLSKEIRKIGNFIIENANTEDCAYYINKEKYNIYSNKDLILIRKKIDEFCIELEGQLSIDTLARIYWIQNDTYKLNLLKSILFASIIYWERRGIDDRYLNFWATITSLSTTLDNVRSFIDYPGNINIISWNYDCQLERAFKQVFPNTNPIFNDTGDNEKQIFKHNGVNFKKLNGSAQLSGSFLIDSKNTSAKGLYNMTDSQIANFLYEIITDETGKLRSHTENVKFCWEHYSSTNYEDTAFKDKYYKIDSTETLVVIGYTFPSINHSLDYRLLKIMTNLKKVYFQGKDRTDAEKIKDYFQAVFPDTDKKINLIAIDSTGFFIPPEATSEIWG